MRPQDFALIVLASGLSERFGEANKLLAELNGKPLIEHVIDAVCPVRFGMRYAVISEDSALMEIFQTASFEIILNADPTLGQGRSLSLGAAKALNDGWTHAVIVLGDMPFIQSDHVHALIENAGDHDAVFSMSEGVKMPPVAVGHEALKRFAQTPRGASGKQNLDGFSIMTLPLSTRSAKDIDTRNDLREVESYREDYARN